MVDVSAKLASVRVAVASGRIEMSAAAAEVIRQGTAAKGDVLGIARIAAIGAAKLTQQLIPLCHAIPIEAVTVTFDWIEPGQQPPTSDPAADGPASRSQALRCTATVRTAAKTGVEMEAMTAVSIGCLTIYDMLKSVDRRMSIGPIALQSKSGGKSGDFQRDGE